MALKSPTQTRRIFHDNTQVSRNNTTQENKLRQQILSFLNRILIPISRNQEYYIIRRQLENEFLTQVIRPSAEESYRLGASYVSKIGGREFYSTDKDIHEISRISTMANSLFWNSIQGLSLRQQQDQKSLAFLINDEKLTISKRLAQYVSWKSLNEGTVSKGHELSNLLSSVQRLGAIGLIRYSKIGRLQKIIADNVLQGAIKDIERRLAEDNPGIFGTLDPFQPALKTVFVFVTQKDERVCPICLDLETEEWEIDSVTIPTIPDSTHPNCRCRIMLAESSNII